jgi:integrase
MSVRKRTWTSGGKKKTAWLVTTWHNGKPGYKQFKTEREAKAYDTRNEGAKLDGSYLSARDSVTVAEAAILWLSSCETRGLEPTSIGRNRQHVEWHIVPLIGAIKLSQLTLPALRSFQDRLRTEPHGKSGKPPVTCSSAMVRAVTTSLSGILSEAQERGLAVKNVVKEKPRGRRASEKRQKRKLQPGEDIPLPSEIQQVLATIQTTDELNRWRPILLTVIFTGLRASEARGLRWGDIDLEHCLLRVRQRLDRHNTAGAPKSATSTRTLPLPTIVVNTLREWKLVYPRPWVRIEGGRKREAHLPEHLVFPNGDGKPESLSNIVRRGLIPAWIAAGLAAPMLDKRGKSKLDKNRQPRTTAKYPGMHALRHFYASWCINRKAEGGLELPGKVVQERMGHSSIMVTMDVYGHLFPTLVADKDFDDAAARLAQT